jgi:hypothetical protein
LATLAELRDIVLNNLERAESDSAVDGDNVDRWINHAIRKVMCTRHNWDAMEATYTVNTVADQELYAFPSSNTKDIKQVALRLSSTSAYGPLREDSEDQLDEDIPLTTISGTPVGWCRAGTAFRLRPAPHVSTFGLRVRAWDYPAALTTDSATNYWTTNHDDLVEDIATALGFKWLGDTEEYAKLLGAAMGELDERIKNDARRLRPKRKTIAPGTRAGRAASSAGPRLGEAGYYRQYP